MSARTMLKADKRSVEYSRGMKERHCGYAFEGDEGFCRFFVEPPRDARDLGACEKVAGSIGRIYWCKLWQRAHTK